MNPNISEAARRVTDARDFLAKCVMESTMFDPWADRFDHAKMKLNWALSALDSAHPAPKGGYAWENWACKEHTSVSAEGTAPKEGVTPETDAVELAVGKWLARYAGKSFTLPEVANYIHNEFDAVRSLELRLAAAKAELEQWKRTALKDREDHVNLRNLCGPALAHSDCEIVALRERLQKAEELLEQAHRFLDCDYEVRVGQLPARIRTFLNQDKT